MTSLGGERKLDPSGPGGFKPQETPGGATTERMLLRLAYAKAADSPDPSTQNGALLAIPHEHGRAEPLLATLACNEFPRGVNYTDERWERPLKYQLIEHAERNAVYRAAAHGICTDGLWMYCPWAACADCARAIIQAGITKLVTHKQAYDRSPARWTDSIAVAFEMLREAGVTVSWYDGTVGAPQLRHAGELWRP